MKILLANKYFFIKGGAENSFFQTSKLLEKNDHEVMHFSMHHKRNFPSKYEKYFVSEVDYEKGGFRNMLVSSGRLLYSFEAKRKLEKLLSEEKPDIAHLNSIYHQISPSILHVLRKHKIPVVMSLRDYKVVCGSYAMVAGNKICEACKGGKYYQCFMKACVKDSRLKSLLNTVEMYLHHTLLNLYGLVDVFISPSRFLKEKVAKMGFKGRVEHLPNFVNAEDFIPSSGPSEKSIVYFGRLSKEKGLSTLIKSVEGLDLDLHMIGEGPIKNELESQVRSSGQSNVLFLGFMTGAALLDEIKKSMFIVLPSEWYENNPRSVIEAFALGKPAIGSRIGGIPELIVDGQTGYMHEMGNAADLREKIVCLSKSPEDIARMGKNARAFLENELSAEKHYRRLIEIYESVR